MELKNDLLVVEGIRYAVGERVLFDGLSLSVRPGELLEVRGPNGCGKSTLLRCLVGLNVPDAGGIRRTAAHVYVGHRPGICARLTPFENLRWFAAIAAADATEESIEDALLQVGLDDAGDATCDSLSAGQERRVALARLLVSPAPLWILDEPLTALDDAGRGLMAELLARHRARGGAAVCATHQPLSTGPDAASARILALGS